jgi:predicted TIM-barrel fold metal-dependent hydrolase
MSYYGIDNRFMLDVIARWPLKFRGIAVVDANAGDPSRDMQSLAHRGVRGFRVAVVDPGATLAGLPYLEKMLLCGARNGSAICFLLCPQLLPDVERLCGLYPDTTVVLDHLARIGMPGPVRKQDVESLCRLARYPRTVVKLSGFYVLGAKRPPHQDLAPLIRSVYDAFGPRRLMWGSDCPFQTMMETYDDSISLVTSGLPFLSTEDKDWILRWTAESLFFR